MTIAVSNLLAIRDPLLEALLGHISGFFDRFRHEIERLPVIQGFGHCSAIVSIARRSRNIHPEIRYAGLHRGVPTVRIRKCPVPRQRGQSIAGGQIGNSVRQSAPDQEQVSPERLECAESIERFRSALREAIGHF